MIGRKKRQLESDRPDRQELKEIMMTINILSFQEGIQKADPLPVKNLKVLQFQHRKNGGITFKDERTQIMG